MMASSMLVQPANLRGLRTSIKSSSTPVASISRPVAIRPRASPLVTRAAALEGNVPETLETLGGGLEAEKPRVKKHSKRFRAMQEKIGVSSNVDLDPMEAIRLCKSSASVKFTESLEAHARLGLDPKYTDQQLRATVNLPSGTGKEMRVAVLTQGANLEAAQAAGAEIAGADDLVDKITGGFLDFDKLIATPDMMPKVARLGRLLGPRGLMPNPKAGTVTTDVTAAIKEFKGGKVEYRLDRSGNVHVLLGRADFTDEQLLDNLKAVQESIDQNKPPGSRGIFWRSMHICTTMGPALRINVSALAAYKPKPK